jgi:hypothetical protein
MIEHIVLIRVKDSATDESIEAARRAVEAMRREIDGVESVVWGPSNSPEGLEQGYTHGFIVRLRDEAARDAYSPHPAHERVAHAVDGIADAVLVFDIPA